MRMFGLLAAMLVLPLLAVRAEAEGEKALALQVTWLGTPYVWEEPRLQTPPPDGWARLERANTADLTRIAAALRRLAVSRELDDFGTLMLVRALALEISLDGKDEPRRFHDAWGRSWDERSRVYFVVETLNQLGYRAVRFEANGRALVGLPTQDSELNARTQTLTIERSLLGRKKAVERTYVLWDVQGRIGDPQTGAAPVELATPLADIFERDPGTLLDFRRRRLPAELTGRKTTAILRWPGGKAAAYNVYPDLARYLSLYPEHHFAAQVRLERQELAVTGITHGLRALAGSMPEPQFVTELLQAVQAGFRYEPGPLRSIHEILASGTGDCDQLAHVLALFLLETGYREDAIAAVVWDGADHMGLALRPRAAAPAQAVRMTLKGADYVVIDPTYYRRRGGEIITAWGEMNPANAELAATVHYLERN